MTAVGAVVEVVVGTVTLWFSRNSPENVSSYNCGFDSNGKLRKTTRVEVVKAVKYSGM